MDVLNDEELIVDYLNDAANASSTEKLDIFYKIQEILLRRSPNLLSKYLQNVLNFVTDKSQEIKKALVGFIENVCKIKESLIPKVILTLQLLLNDSSVPVQKRVIQATITIYRKILEWLCKAVSITEEMESAWMKMNKIKSDIATMIDSDNDGIRTSAVKFIECVIMLQTYPDEVENKRSNDFSLDDVPLTLKIARRRKLEEEASNLFQILVQFHGSPHISSANLLACIGVLTNIAKNRAEFMGEVIDALESLFSNFPPTLTKTQVNSVRKKLKTELMGLIKHPAAFDFVEKITALLVELGMQQQEIVKLLPKPEERKKYNKRTLVDPTLRQPLKSARTERQFEYDDNDEPSTPFEANEQFILENLTLEKAIYLLFTSFPKLPNTMPPQFAIDYDKYVKSGHIGKIFLAEVLSNQFIEANVGPGTKIKVPDERTSESNKRKRNEEDDVEKIDKVAKKERIKVPKIKTLKLTEITKPLDKHTKEKLLNGSVKRLLSTEKNKTLHQKLITTLAACFNASVRENVLNYLISDLKLHVDIALSWLFEEYSIMQGFSRVPPLRVKDLRLDQAYNNLLCRFITVANNDIVIISRLLLEAPLVTEDALNLFRAICCDEKSCGWALGLLRDLTIRKPPKQLTFLNVLLSFTTYESVTVRDKALEHVLELHKRQDLKLIIEEFARMNLEFLKLQRPPDSLCGEKQGRLKSETWGDDFIKACLLPYVSLLPVNESLIHDLSKVYIQTSPDIKRIILRLIENPIRAMGMDSPDLLKLVEDCPKGSETLVTRVIHILTDKGPPSQQLVQRVRELYNTRVSDVRFLIPVLNGLTKKEIISALPKLIKLNPIVVREVFNRLLGLHGESPITPTELLVALHLIDFNKVDLKMVIKATSLCLQEKQVYTQEVLAVVLQQLVDQTVLPTLLMRTVIQALGSYPRLSGFVMNILQKLILKQVWKNKVVWEGFIKCCQRTKPQSFPVLMQLPPPQLTEVLNSCPDLKEPLKEHLLTFTDGQKSHIPAAIQEIILGTASNIKIPATTPTIDAAEPKVLNLNEPLPPGME